MNKNQTFTQDDPKKMAGKFISFEGGEGVGKSTQVALLANRLRHYKACAGHKMADVEIIVTREPGGSTGAEAIRRLLLSGPADKWTPMSEVLLFYAARVDHLQKIILPALQAGHWVISDRYADSTFAYQGAGHGLAPAVISEIHHITTNDFWPDLTLVLDHDPVVGLERAHQRESKNRAEAREDRYENMAENYHRRLNASFREQALKTPDRYRLIRAGDTKDAVAAQVWQEVCSKFNL